MNPTPAKTDKTGRSASRLIEKAVVALLTKSTIKAAAREIGSLETVR